MKQSATFNFVELLGGCVNSDNTHIGTQYLRHLHASFGVEGKIVATG